MHEASLWIGKGHIQLSRHQQTDNTLIWSYDKDHTSSSYSELALSNLL